MNDRHGCDETSRSYGRIALCAGLTLILVCFAGIVSGEGAELDTIACFSPHFTERDLKRGVDPSMLGELRGKLPWPSVRYGLQIRYFGEKHLDGFTDAMRRAGILVVLPDAGQTAAETIFDKPEYVDAVNAFLKRGGVLFFQYLSAEYARDYLKNVGVESPPTPTHFSGYGIAIARDAADDPILTSPNRLVAPPLKLGGGLGWWTKWPSKMKPLLVPGEHKENAAMLVRRNVNGKGTVIFCQVITFNSERHMRKNPFYREFVMNLYSSAFGSIDEVVRKIEYRSSADNTMQPALFYDPGNEKPAPLLVALHQWSSDYLKESSDAYAQWCMDHDWVMIFPNFRGPNMRPQACMSNLAAQDILDAVEYARKNASIDPDRIYLVGVSGGGHASLVMAGRYPDVWTAVSAWVPVTDLRAFYEHCKGSERYRRYAGMVAACCGGVPGASSEVDQQYARRSPVTQLSTVGDLPLDINTGIHDGHAGSVPVSHALSAFNCVAEEGDRISETDIDFMVKNQAIPEHLGEPPVDATYGKKKPLFRRQSGNARVTVFDGGHEIVTPAALSWLEKHSKNSR